MATAESSTPCPLSDLPVLGKATHKVYKDGRVIIHATHALAMLRLIEKEGSVEIRVQSSEIEALKVWPIRSFTWTIPDSRQESWAHAAIELLKRGPPPIGLWRRMALLALTIFFLTFCALDFYFRTGLIF